MVDKMDIVEGAEEADEVTVHKELLADLTKTAREVQDSVNGLVEKVISGPNPDDGISFLSMKNGLLLEYNMNLTYLMIKKTKGESIVEDPAVERLCYLRTVLEKIRPIEQKLKYQVEKFVNIAETGQSRPDDPLSFKPNPNLLASKFDGDENSDESEDEDGKEKKSDKYVAPRNIPQKFDGDKTKDEIEADMIKKTKKTQLSKTMMNELKSQLWDTPEEISHQADTRKQKYIQQQREKEIYEEDNFIRLPVSKAEKMARAQLSTVSNIGASLTAFGQNNYDGNKDVLGGDPKGKKRKHSEKKGGKGKKNKFKKRK